MRRLPVALLLLPLLLSQALAADPPAKGATARPARNVILFVADGLRPGMVNEKTAPAMTALMKQGVRFTNTHSLFPTFTTPNASAMATGHQLGDTGNFSNYIYTGYPVPTAGGSVTPFLENDPVLGDIDDHFAGNYLNETTILRAAAEAGLSTAAIGKLGPTLIFDHTKAGREQSIIADDSTGRSGGVPLLPEVQAAMQKAGIATQAPTRGENGKAGDATNPGTEVANVQQQAWFTDLTTRVVLPLFKQRQKPFVLVYWSRDPDGTQHNQGDSLRRLLPGINGPTSLAAIRNADDNLARILATLKSLGLEATTDVLLTSDHGFSTISKESATSWAAQQINKGVPQGLLPPGFLAMDIANGLGLKLFDPDAPVEARERPLQPGMLPLRANGLIGDDPAKPLVVVAANGGSDLVYLPKPDKALAEKVVKILAEQDYTSGLFVDSRLGPIRGTLPLSSIALEGSAITPIPAIVVNFRSFTTGCADVTTCGVVVADTGLQQGQGMHGSFSRAETRNIMGAVGPGFRTGYTDPAPVSNADLGKTIAHLLGLSIKDKGKLPGRVLTEAMPNGAQVGGRPMVMRSDPDDAGRVTVLKYQVVGQTRYFDAAGYPGRTLGLGE
ncbi:MAG: alkaline phosphatase family protein [Acetobacteraceae bacterium]|nr:alkaline phosphatase family protein [Pseudomonadota bacterium]